MFPKEIFREYLKTLEGEFQDKQGFWKLRGFIDIARRVYSLNAEYQGHL